MSATPSELTARASTAASIPVHAHVPIPRAHARSVGTDRARAWALAGAFMIGGLVLRLALVRGLWVDEAISVHQAHMTLGGLLHNLRETDNHPPLYFLTLWATVRVLGYGELAVHVPSIVFGTLLIPALYLTGCELFGRRTALVAAGLGTVAPLVVWYSQEARMYSLFMLLATLAVWAQVRALRDGRARFWVAYAALTIGMLYTHYFSVLPIVVQQAAFAGVAWQRARSGQPVRGLLVSVWLVWLAVLLAVLPLAPFVVTQFHHDQSAGTGFGDARAAVGQQTGSSMSIYALLSNVVWAIWGYHADSTMFRIVALWPLLMLVGLALLGRGRSPRSLLAVALVAFPILALLGLGTQKRDLFEVRYFAGAVPMILLLCARAVSTFSARRLPVLIAAALLVVTMGVGLADQQLNGSNPRTYDFRGAIADIRAHARPGDTVLYTPDYLNDVIAYYAPQLHARVLRTGAPAVPARGRVFLLASFLEDPRTASIVGSARHELAHGPRRLVASYPREKIDLYEFQ